MQRATPSSCPVPCNEAPGLELRQTRVCRRSARPVTAGNGYTLIEILLVAFVLGIAALAAIPNLSSGEERALTVAASEIADALRFARSEAMRTGVHHGVRVEAAGARIRLYWLEVDGAPVAEHYTVIHPLDKSLYDLSLESESATRGTAALGYFVHANPRTPLEDTSFDPSGRPVRSTDLQPLETGGVILYNGNSSIAVALGPTGRVSIGELGGPVGDPDSVFPPPVGPSS